LRKTLWERALDEKKLQEASKELENCDTKDEIVKCKKKADKPWWTMEWISSIQHGAGRYPIICKVEKAVAEFPYDQESQTEIRRLLNNVSKGKVDGEKIRRKRKIEEGRQKPFKNKPPMCLAVTLRPLAPIVPAKDPYQGEILSTPPVFSVLVFPSEKLPFLIPLVLAFRTSLMFSSEDNVKVAESDGAHHRAKVLSRGDEQPDQYQRLITSFQEILKNYGNMELSAVQKLDAMITEAYSKTNTEYFIPEADLRAIIQTILYQYHTRNTGIYQNNNTGSLELSNTSNVGMKDSVLSLLWNITHLVRCNLPKWQCIPIELDGNKAVKHVCPWQLSFSEGSSLGDEVNAALAPSVLISSTRTVWGGCVHLIPESLRMMLESAVKYMIENDQLMFDFIAPINLSLAPEYMHVVPIPTCFRKILKRLKPQSLKYPKALNPSGEDNLEEHGYGNIECCFYRSIEALRSDITDVFQNCLLYNA
jgi:hypothetical protein